MYLLFDIGGSKTRLAVSKDKKNLYQVEIIPTPQDFREGIKFLVDSGKRITGGKKIKMVAGGIAGPLNKNKTKLANSPNLPQWANQPLFSLLKKEFKSPVFLENDAALAGLGEVYYGAGKGGKIVAYLTISTGVGGARLVEGQIDQNYFGFEPGQQIINYDALINFQTLEANISGTGLFKKYKKPAAELSAKKIWEREAKLLAYGLNNITVLWSPEIIILGGSVMKKISLKEVRKQFKQTVKIFPGLPKIKRSKLGDLSGIYGALAILNTKNKR